MKPSEIDWFRVMNFWEFMLMMSLNHNASITGGPRTELRNANLTNYGNTRNGHPKSRHLWKYGWGCACDFMFDEVEDRLAAEIEIQEEGYHTYRGEDYRDEQLHCQIVAPGVELHL